MNSQVAIRISKDERSLRDFKKGVEVKVTMVELR